MSKILFVLMSLSLGILSAKDLCYPEVSPKNWAFYNKRNTHACVSGAWSIETGKPFVLIAVIDTGIDFTHPALEDKAWYDPDNHEISGWNFTNNTPNPKDNHGHGTHISGIIAAQFNKQMNSTGVAPGVKLMAIKYYLDHNTGAVNLKNTVSAIKYAVDHKAKIINYSGGGPEFSEDEYLALRYARSEDVLIVTAVGNLNRNIEITEDQYFPASYKMDNVISVAATDESGSLASYSNYGLKSADVAAPGFFYSTFPKNKYGDMSGTSQATAFVTGVAALMLSKNPSLKPNQIKEMIKKSVTKVTSMKRKIASGGRINAYNAVKLAEQSLSRDTVKDRSKRDRPIKIRSRRNKARYAYKSLETPITRRGSSSTQDQLHGRQTGN